MQQPGRQINPVMQFRNLNWLAKLQAEAHDLEARIDDLYRQYRAASKQCMDQQQRVDVIKQHRKECLAEFVSDESARLAGEQDRDWLARTHVEGKDSGADENRAAGENA